MQQPFKCTHIDTNSTYIECSVATQITKQQQNKTQNNKQQKEQQQKNTKNQQH